MHLIYKCESSGVDCAYGGQLPARPCIPAFHEAPKHVRVRLEKKWLTGLISTPEFIDWDQGNEKTGDSQFATPSQPHT